MQEPLPPPLASISQYHLPEVNPIVKFANTATPAFVASKLPFANVLLECESIGENVA